MTNPDLALSFANILEAIVDVDHDATRHQLADLVWAETMKFDFHPMDMDCDDALVELDLARRVGEGEDEDVQYRDIDYRLKD